MGVDRIGSGGTGPGPTPDVSPARDTSSASEPFEVNAPTTAGEASAAGEINAELQGLESGALSLDQVLDARVEAATTHLADKLSPEHLEMIREQLRVELTSDPALVRLAQRAGLVAG